MKGSLYTFVRAVRIKNIRLLITTQLCLVLAITSIPAFGLSTVDFPSQGIRYYDPNSKTVSTCGTNKGSADIKGDTNQERIWNWLRSQGLSDNQTAGLMGNVDQESEFSGTRHQDGSPWPSGGWGLVQWTGPRRTALQNKIPTAIKHVYDIKYGGAPAKDGKHPLLSVEDNASILDYELNYIMQESQGRVVSRSVASQGYGKAGANEWETLKQQKTVEDATVFWHNNFEVSADSAATVLAKRLGPAKELLATFGSSDSGSGGTVSGDNCTGAGSDESAQTNSTILNTINSLAWHKPTTGLSLNTQATAAYQTAAKKYFGNGYGNNSYADCTYFVATVMRESGIDKDFPIGTTAISAYLKKSSKFKLITNPKVSDLQPGDIIQHTQGGTVAGYGTYSGHIMIYTGPQKGDDGVTYYGADASKYTRVPGYISMRSVEAMFNKSPVVIARAIAQ